MSKTAVVYYSYSNNTKRIAEMIQNKTGGDLYRIETVAPYTGSYEDVVDQAKIEIKDGFQPPIQPLNGTLDEYDTIFLGTPVWWYTMAPPVLTFLSQNDLKGKKVVPFATNAGWLGHTLKDISKLCAGSEVGKSMNIEFSEQTLKTSEKVIEDWIESMV